MTIGYMGTLTHEADLRMVLAPLRALLRRHAGRVRLELVGGGARQTVRRRSSRACRSATLHPRHEDAYPKFVPWMRRHLRWDVAIAPLEDDAFTRCKSDLKYLDYAALGIPGVFSDVRPYRDTVRHRETGLLAANDREGVGGRSRGDRGRRRAARAPRGGARRPRCTAAAC